MERFTRFQIDFYILVFCWAFLYGNSFVTPVLASVNNYEDTSQTDCPCSFILNVREREREREMFYLTMHSTHFIYSYMASDIWLRTILKPAAAT